MKKVAIIGAGFAGLGVGFHLVERCKLTIFDGLGVGRGASGVASGLAHPYAGEQVRRSLYAKQALEALHNVLDTLEYEMGCVLADRGGVLRYPQDEAQREALLRHAIEWKDVAAREDGSFWISSGVTLDAPRYLDSLASFIVQRGGVFKTQKITSLSELGAYDQIVIAAGASSLQFPECAGLRCHRVKGQIWTAEGAYDLAEKSSLGKGYLALDFQPGVYHLGSTYEKKWDDEAPEFHKGLEGVLEKIGKFFPKVHDLKVTACHAGVRLIRVGHYFPFVMQVNPKTWVFTALGSRGILYHAYLGKQLVDLL